MMMVMRYTSFIFIAVVLSCLRPLGLPGIRLETNQLEEPEPNHEQPQTNLAQTQEKKPKRFKTNMV
jgi:hypothetical protein